MPGPEEGAPEKRTGLELARDLLRDRQFFAVVREEVHERPMHQLSQILTRHEGRFYNGGKIDQLLCDLWRDKP